MDFGPSWPEAGDRLKGRFFDTHNSIFYQMEEMYMEFFASAVDTLKVLVMKQLTGKDIYEQKMLEIRRKSLALCPDCFAKLHMPSL